MSKKNKQKVIVIVGTTASGKTNLAVDLAMKFNGEVISSDSRQVYKYMDIGSGKDLNEYHIDLPGGDTLDIPYHLIDVVKPNDEYDLAKWLRDAKLAINDIANRNKLCVIAGGTGLYTQALIDGYNLSSVAENKELRAQLEELSKEELFQQLKIKDQDLADSLNNSEKNNKRRLIRHLEIISSSNILKGQALVLEKETPYEHLILGISWPREVLRERIYKRLIARLDNENMMDEVLDLHKKHKVSWERLESFGLEYRFLAMHLQNKLSYEEMIEKLHIATCQFAKRQISWLKRWERQGADIHWIKDYKDAETKVSSFLKQ